MQAVVTSDALLVLCSCPDQVIAEQLAQTMVSQKLSACVQIVPGITSIYRWEEKICQENEVLLVIKTAADMIKTLTRWLVREHPYDVPEVIALPISAGSQIYIDWLLNNSTGIKNLDD